MKPKITNPWLEIAEKNTAGVRKKLPVKQNIAKTIGLPAGTILIELFEGSMVELTDGPKMGFALLHFVDAKNNRFAFMASPMELQDLRNICTDILKDMGCEEAVGTLQ